MIIDRRKRIRDWRRLTLHCMASEIEGEQASLKRNENNKQLGPKLRLEQLLLKNFPDEEAIKRLKTEYNLDESNDPLISNWLEDIKKDIANGKIANILKNEQNKEIER